MFRLQVNPVAESGDPAVGTPQPTAADVEAGNGASRSGARSGGKAAKSSRKGVNEAAVAAAVALVAECGRVQAPIGLVPRSAGVQVYQIFAILLFATINLILVVLSLWGSLALYRVIGLASLALVIVTSILVAALVAFNVRTAGSPRAVLERYLRCKRRTRLVRKMRPGQVVVVEGMVSLFEEELLSSKFHNVLGLVLVETSLRSYFAGDSTRNRWVEHVRQTRAVDFRITDPSTGASAIVKAFDAAETGVATPLVHMSSEARLPTPPTKGGDGKSGKDGKAWSQSPSGEAAQLTVCKGYIRQGQVVTVMGVVEEDSATGELVILPLSQPRNISKLLFFHYLVPYFFPTFASGLIISDERSLK
eukprot:TRINITY_DN11578_c0_g2_i1.p1 TRINITY_DN11578_c0_g2~~TRINITY_DN11578_c0_g2_i1.p1  ORF type:complete len:363 (+),score=-12.66 TRINITY_DN11578_c0_g2_i1:303-1391(+)